MRRVAGWWAGLLMALPCWASGQVAITGASDGELSSASGGSVGFTVRTERAGALTLEMLTGDGDVVRSVTQPQASAGEHTLRWDGKDEQGRPVPDEAYCPRVTLVSAGDTAVADTCRSTGGEVMEGIKPTLSGAGDIGYTLDRPARVLIRVGIKGGAMMRSLSVWRPRPAGRNLQRWNGFDDSGKVNLRNDRMALLVTAFALPDFSVITTGVPDLDYRRWRIGKGWPERPDEPSGDATAQPLERNGKRIARPFYMARYKDAEPRISVSLTDRQGQPLADTGVVHDEMRVMVDLHPDDRWLMQEQLYEVAFFVDGDFVSEEENGYVPIGWVWSTAALQPGKHLLTVNLTGFTGRVGTRSIEIRKGESGR